MDALEAARAIRERLCADAMEPAYLGDGLYVQFDDYQYVLYTDNDRVYLDPDVLKNFIRHIKKVKEAFAFTL